jgi:hypothetical protein
LKDLSVGTVVAVLSEQGKSNVAIAEATGVTETTIRRDKDALSTNVEDSDQKVPSDAGTDGEVSTNVEDSDADKSKGQLANQKGGSDAWSTPRDLFDPRLGRHSAGRPSGKSVHDDEQLVDLAPDDSSEPLRLLGTRDEPPARDPAQLGWRDSCPAADDVARQPELLDRQGEFRALSQRGPPLVGLARGSVLNEHSAHKKAALVAAALLKMLSPTPLYVVRGAPPSGCRNWVRPYLLMAK